jgi:methylated-DNA-protein-cysteine methyltransferase related protein
MPIFSHKIKRTTYKTIYKIVAKIPYGRVATYGQIAKLAGIPGQARQVGYALSAVTDNHIPWHRVINAKGEISPRSDSAFAILQHELLEHEGVKFNSQGKISLHLYRWKINKS